MTRRPSVWQFGHGDLEPPAAVELVLEHAERGTAGRQHDDGAGRRQPIGLGDSSSYVSVGAAVRDAVGLEQRQYLVGARPG